MKFVRLNCLGKLFVPVDFNKTVTCRRYFVKYVELSRVNNRHSTFVKLTHSVFDCNIELNKRGYLFFLTSGAHRPHLFTRSLFYSFKSVGLSQADQFTIFKNVALGERLPNN